MTKDLAGLLAQVIPVFTLVAVIELRSRIRDLVSKAEVAQSGEAMHRGIYWTSFGVLMFDVTAVAASVAGEMYCLLTYAKPASLGVVGTSLGCVIGVAIMGPIFQEVGRLALSVPEIRSNQLAYTGVLTAPPIAALTLFAWAAIASR